MDKRTPLALIVCAAFLVPPHHPLAQGTRLSSGWLTEPVSDGITWKKQQFDELYGAPQQINLLDIDLQAHSLRFVTLDELPKTVSEIGTQHQAPAAVNGTYFDIKTQVSTTFIKIDDRIVSLPDPVEPRQRAAITIDPSGRVDIIRRPEEEGWKKILPYRHIMASSPTLVTRGKPWNHREHEYGDHRHPRTAVGVTEDNRLLLITVDGRSKLAAGMSYTELAKTMTALGCRSALCLDGGGSSTMWIQGKGVVNTPANRSLISRLPVERPVANAILVTPKPTKN